MKPYCVHCHTSPQCVRYCTKYRMHLRYCLDPLACPDYHNPNLKIPIIIVLVTLIYFIYRGLGL